MKKWLFTVLTFLLVVGLVGSRMVAAGQLQKDGIPPSSQIGSGSGDQKSLQAVPLLENPMADATDPGKPPAHAELNVRVGQEFNITLSSNPTTGYLWKLAAPLDEALVKLVSKEYKGPETNMLGAGGQEVWTFRAVSHGKTSFSLKYVRPWEKDVAPDKIASYTVNVH